MGNTAWLLACMMPDEAPWQTLPAGGAAPTERRSSLAMIYPMAQTEGPDRSALVRSAAELGQAAWLFGNLYEAAVGVPQLLGLARAERRPGLARVGSPVRYYAPIAPLAVGASAIELLTAWRYQKRDRFLTAVSAGGLAVALGLSGYLIRTVNVPLLTAGDLGLSERRRLETTWHRANTVRIAALTVTMGTNRLRLRRR